MNSGSSFFPSAGYLSEIPFDVDHVSTRNRKLGDWVRGHGLWESIVGCFHESFRKLTQNVVKMHVALEYPAHLFTSH